MRLTTSAYELGSLWPDTDADVLCTVFRAHFTNVFTYPGVCVNTVAVVVRPSRRESSRFFHCLNRTGRREKSKTNNRWERGHARNGKERAVFGKSRFGRVPIISKEKKTRQ